MAEPTEASVTDLVRQLTMQATTLVHEEVELAKAELTEKAKWAGLGSGLLAGAAVVALLAAGALVAAAIAGLGTVLPIWAAAAVVGGALLLAGGTLAAAGRAELAKGTPPVPEQAVESTKEDIEWLKTQARSARP